MLASLWLAKIFPLLSSQNTVLVFHMLDSNFRFEEWDLNDVLSSPFGFCLLTYVNVKSSLIVYFKCTYPMIHSFRLTKELLKFIVDLLLSCGTFHFGEMISSVLAINSLNSCWVNSINYIQCPHCSVMYYHYL